MTDRSYAAELGDDDAVVRVIVGDAQWAAEAMGGRWVDSDVKVGLSWRSRREGFLPWDKPLNEAQALAALMVARGALDSNDAANAVGLLPVDLAHEVRAWAAASGVQANRAGRLRSWWRKRGTKRLDQQEVQS
jgi:hypothetical protein